MGNSIVDYGRSHLSQLLRVFFGRTRLEKTRLSPLKILLYLESHQRYRRASSPRKLGREIGIGGYKVIIDSYVWLKDHGYVAPAPGVPAEVAEIRDPNELVVTPLGRKALEPYLKAYTSWEVVGVTLTTMGLGWGLGAIMVFFMSYASFLWLEALLGGMIIMSMVAVAATVLAIGRRKYVKGVARLINAVVDRDEKQTRN
jgi:hypothetical protein